MTTNAPQPDSLTPIPDHTHCPKCAYDLTASVSPKCSECGYDLACFRQKESAIPWTHRKTQGYFRSYAKTVWLVIFKHKKFCQEIVRPVSYGDARKFQLVTVILAFLPALTTIAAAYRWYPYEDHNIKQQPFNFFRNANNQSLLDLAYMDVWPVVLFLAGLLVCFVAMTSVPSYFFHPRQLSTRQQNRAIALSYYTAAPMALIIIAYAVEILILSFFWPNNWVRPQTIFRPNYFNASIGFLLFGPFTIACAISWVAFFQRIYQTHKCIMPLARNYRIALVTILPIAWLLLVFMCLVCIPYSIIYILVVIKSLS